jgi:hypothetical protein
VSNVLIISSDYYATENLAAELQKHGVTVTTVYRDYHFDDTLQGVDVVATDGTCKTSDGTGQSMPIRFTEPRKAAKRLHVPCIRYRHRSGLSAESQEVISARAQEILRRLSQ